MVMQNFARFSMMSALAVFLVMLMLLADSAFAGTFRDDFEDGDLAGWLETFADKPAADVWKVKNGVLIGRRSSGWGAHLTIGDADTWKDYTIECDMRVTERIPNEWGGNFHYAGVVGRFQSENQLTRDILGFVLNFKIAPTVWDFVIVQKNQWLRNVQKPFNAKLNTWYHIKSVMQGQRFEFYVNGTFLSSFQSGAIPTGRVGLVIGGCVAEFDNVIITGPDVPDKRLTIVPKNQLTTTWGKLKAF